MKSGSFSKKSKKVIQTGCTVVALAGMPFLLPGCADKKIEEKEEINYSVIFEIGYGNDTITKKIREGNKLVKPEDPVREGYVFLNWELDGNVFDFNTEINHNIVLTANWYKVEENSDVYVVKFNTNNGTTIANKVIKEGNLVLQPITPVREGYVFLGWYHLGRRFDFDKPIDSDITLDAIWLSKESDESKKDLPTPILTNGNGEKENGVVKCNFNIISEGPYAGVTNRVEGYELYEKNKDEYKLLSKIDGLKSFDIVVELGNKKTFVVRTFNYDKNAEKVFSSYSNEIVIDNSLIEKPTLSKVLSNVELDKTIKTKLTIFNEGFYKNNKDLISGYELYEKIDNKYKLIIDNKKLEDINVSVEQGEKDIFVVRTYVINKNKEKLFSSYSNQIIIDNSDLPAPTLTNAKNTINGDGIKTYNLNIVTEGAYVGSQTKVEGYELYEKNGKNHKLIKDVKSLTDVNIDIDLGETKVLLARVYKINKSNKKVYSEYSNEITIINSVNMLKPTLSALDAGFTDDGLMNKGLNISIDGAYKNPNNKFTGFEVYEKVGNEYKLVGTVKNNENVIVALDYGESKIYRARAFRTSKSGKKFYSDYSKEITLSNYYELPAPTIHSESAGASEENNYLTYHGLDIYTEGYYANNDYDGYEIYEILGTDKYKLVDEAKKGNFVLVGLDIKESKDYVARAYKTNKVGKKFYSSYSNSVTIKNSIDFPTPVLSKGEGVSSDGNIGGYLNIFVEGPYAKLESAFDGYEIYEKIDNNYKLLEKLKPNGQYNFKVSYGVKKIYAARVFAINKSGKKVYTDYSKDLVIDNSNKLPKPTLTSDFGGVVEDGSTDYNLNIINIGPYASGNIYYTGYELYEKIDGKSVLLADYKNKEYLHVILKLGEKRTYLARTYITNSDGKKIYSQFSDEVIIDNSNILIPTLSSELIGVTDNGDGSHYLFINKEGHYQLPQGIAGFELYERNGKQYKLLKDCKKYDEKVQVNIKNGETKTYAVRVYAYNQYNKKVYSEYSHSLTLGKNSLFMPTLSCEIIGVTDFGDVTYNMTIFEEGEYLTKPNSVSGFEIYEKIENHYEFVADSSNNKQVAVSMKMDRDRTYVAKAYKIDNYGEKIYSPYSIEKVISFRK